MNREMLYNDLSGFLAMHFPCKVQKISINAGFTCPNRDGSVGYGGCTYCNNQTFNPAYCHTGKSVTQQFLARIKSDIWYYPFPESGEASAWLYIAISIVIALTAGFTTRKIYAIISRKLSHF